MFTVGGLCGSFGLEIGEGLAFVAQCIIAVKNIMSALCLQKRRAMRIILFPDGTGLPPSSPTLPVFKAFHARSKEHHVMPMFAVREVNADNFVCTWRMERFHILIQHQALVWNVLTFLFQNQALVWSILTLLFSKSSSRVGRPHVLLQKQAPAWRVPALSF